MGSYTFRNSSWSSAAHNATVRAELADPAHKDNATVRALVVLSVHGWGFTSLRVVGELIRRAERLGVEFRCWFGFRGWFTPALKVKLVGHPHLVHAITTGMDTPVDSEEDIDHV